MRVRMNPYTRAEKYPPLRGWKQILGRETGRTLFACPMSEWNQRSCSLIEFETLGVAGSQGEFPRLPQA